MTRIVLNFADIWVYASPADERRIFEAKVEFMAVL